jgi:hypothetical protein
MQVQTNQPYTNRVQLLLTPFFGPFVQPGPLGDFDPRRDVEVYVDGVRQVVQTFSYDPVNNRYLLYMQNEINLQGTIQLVYHTVSPPFQGRVQAEADATASTGTGAQLAWIAHTNYALGQTIVDTNGNLQVVVGIIGDTDTGTSGGSMPTWPTFEGDTVTDNNLIWATHVLTLPEIPWVPGVAPSGSVAVNTPPTFSPPNLIQTNTVSTHSSGGVCFGTFLDPVTAGNTLAVFVYSDSTDLTLTISDSYFNTWTRQIFNSDSSDAIFAYTATANSTGTFAITSVANEIVGQTTYTGTFRAFLNGTATISGFVNSGNNGSFSIVSSTPTTLTVFNSGGVAETHAAMAVILLIVQVNHGSTSRILIGLAELSESSGFDVASNNKQYSTSTVTSGSFTTTGIGELALGFFAAQGGSPGFTENSGWAIDTTNPAPSILVSKGEPTPTTDAALTTVDTIIVFDQETQASGVVLPNPNVTTITTPFLTPSTNNTWAALFVGSFAVITPNGAWTPFGGSLFGHGYQQILTNTNPIQGSLQDAPQPFSGGGADGTPWGLILLLFKLNGNVPPSITGNGFQTSGAGGSGTGNFANSSPGNTILIVQTSNWIFPTTMTVSDSQGNTYSHYYVDPGKGYNGSYPLFTGNYQSLDVWVAENIVGGPNVVTYSNSAFVANWDILGVELEAGYEFRSAAMAFHGQPHAGTGAYSQTLTISGFDFPTPIPSNATVTGMEFVVTGSQSEAYFSSFLSVSPTNPLLTSPPVFTTQLPATTGDMTFGSPTETFGYTLTPAFVNDPSNFVFNLQAADTNGNNVTFNFESSVIKVYYYTLQNIILGATLSGFAQIGDYSTQGDDTLFPPQAVLTPNAISQAVALPLTLTWSTSAVSYIRITAADSYDTGIVPVSGGQGTTTIPGSNPLLGTAGTITFQMVCYDSNQSPINVNGAPSPNVMLAVYLT